MQSTSWTPVYPDRKVSIVRIAIGLCANYTRAPAIMSAALLSSSVALRATLLVRCLDKALRIARSAPPSRTTRAMAPSQDELKKPVGYKSVDDHVESGMAVGLGTGSTAYFAVERLGQKLASGELTDIIAIPTSERTREQAESLKIPLCTLNEKSVLDVAIDGADEVDPDLALVKGGGGALLREKMVEVMAKKFVVIVDESKLCKGLGPGFPFPVEITPFCHMHTLAARPPALPSVARAARRCSAWAARPRTSPTATKSQSRTTATTSWTCTSRSPSRT